MKQLILCMAVITATASIASADRNPTQPDLTFGKFYLTIVTKSPAGSDGQRLLSYFKENKTLATIASKSALHIWNDQSPEILYTNWRFFLGTDRPALIFQAPAEPDGTAKVLFFANSIALMPSAEGLEHNLVFAIQNYVASRQKTVDGLVIPEWIQQCPIRPRPKPTPPPAPEPKPAPAPNPDPVILPVDVTVNPQPAEKNDKEPIPIWMFLIPAAGLGFGIYKGLQDK